MGLLFDRDYTKEFQGVKHEITSVKKEINSTNEELSILINKIDTLQKDLDLIKSYILKPESTNPPKKLIRKVAKARQKIYSKLTYTDFEFITSKNAVPSFDISDVYRLSLFIEDKSKFPSVRKLYQAVLPTKSLSNFERLLYNYQEGLFDEYLVDYKNNTTFTSKENLLYINGLNTNLTIAQLSEIVAILNNSANDIYGKYECIDKFVRQYSTHEPKYIKIIGDFIESYKLQRSENRNICKF